LAIVEAVLEDEPYEGKDAVKEAPAHSNSTSDEANVPVLKLYHICTLRTAKEQLETNWQELRMAFEISCACLLVSWSANFIKTSISSLATSLKLTMANLLSAMDSTSESGTLACLDSPAQCDRYRKLLADYNALRSNIRATQQVIASGGCTNE
jgi:hypothetical protein